MASDGNQQSVSPAAMRNKGFICDVLKRVLPEKGTILEVGSGSGEHVLHFAENLPDLSFQPTERHEETVAVMAERLAGAGFKNITPPLKADLLDDALPLEQADGMIAINVLHIAPWETTLALLCHASKILRPGAPLYLYGPYHRSDMATVESNLHFDQALKARDPSHGLRHLDDITTHAKDCGLGGPHIIEMPANNLSVVYTKN